MCFEWCGDYADVWGLVIDLSLKPVPVLGQKMVLCTNISDMMGSRHQDKLQSEMDSERCQSALAS